MRIREYGATSPCGICSHSNGQAACDVSSCLSATGPRAPDLISSNQSTNGRTTMNIARDGSPPVTPDGRYLVVRGRLWRRSNPALTFEQRETLVHDLMSARRAVREALASQDTEGLLAARLRVDAAKVGLGERGPVWWTDGAPDLNRHMARTTPYAEWFAGLGG